MRLKFSRISFFVVAGLMLGFALDSVWLRAGPGAGKGRGMG